MKFVTLCSFLVWEGPIDTGLCPNVLYLLILVSQTSVIFIVVLLLNILADTYYCFYHREYKLLVARHLAWHQSHTYTSTLPRDYKTISGGSASSWWAVWNWRFVCCQLHLPTTCVINHFIHQCCLPKSANWWFKQLFTPVVVLDALKIIQTRSLDTNFRFQNYIMFKLFFVIMSSQVN